MVESFYFPLVFLTAFVGIGVAGLAWYERDQPGAKALTAFALAGSFWAACQGMVAMVSGAQTMELWTQLSLTGAALVPVAWFVLVVQYTGRDRWLNWKSFGGLLVWPAIFLALLWTNDRHSLVWSPLEVSTVGSLRALSLDFGLAFWAHQIFFYLLVAAGAAVLGQLLLSRNELSQWQATALLGAISLPAFANLVFIWGFFPSGLDPTGIATVLAAAIIGVAMFESTLHSIAPVTREIGREAVLEDLDDCVLILDDDGHVVDVNPAAESLLGASAQEVLGNPLADYVPELAETIDDTPARAEIELERDGKLLHYDVQLSSLSRGFGAFSGTVVSLRDVSDRLERQQRLDVLNRLLRHNVRNELNLVQGNIELARGEIDNDVAVDRLTDASETVDHIVDRSNKVGRLSRMLDSRHDDSIDIAAELRGEHDRGKLAPDGGRVEIDLPAELAVSGGASLVAAFEELIENGIQHNDAADPWVRVSVNDEQSGDDHVVIEVTDNGPGIEDQEWQTISDGRETPLQHTSGVGLWLVNWVIRRAGGTIEFENGDGTTVSVRLPRGEASTAGEEGEGG